jgi:hypothetical protein
LTLILIQSQSVSPTQIQLGNETNERNEMTNAITFESPSKKTKFGNIVRHPSEGFYTRKPSWTGTGNSGKKFLIHTNGCWYYSYVNFKKTSLGYKLDEVSKALEQL